jgi:hypothetical protein
LARAFENTPEKYSTVRQIAKKHLRDYITSIYSVKAAEKKIK